MALEIDTRLQIENDVSTTLTEIAVRSGANEVFPTRQFRNPKEQVDTFIAELRFTANVRDDLADDSHIRIGWSNPGNGYSEEY